MIGQPKVSLSPKQRGPNASISEPQPLSSRRDLLKQVACGFGYAALAGLTAGESQAEAARSSYANPLAARRTHHPAKAKRVIFLFLHGGLSHVDSFDPKPKLSEMDGQPVPIEKPMFNFSPTGNLLKSPWKFKKYGQSGIDVSELFPHVGGVIDDICVIRSMQSNFVAHGGASLQLHTGDGILVRPSLGAWTLYGLGTENQNLPGFVTISPTFHHGGAQNFGTAFLPAIYQGTPIGDCVTPLRDQAGLRNLEPAEADLNLQRWQLDLLAKRNRRHLERRDEDARLDARIEAFELAFRMQMRAPEVLDLSGETEETLALYGINQDPTDDYGRGCLTARRLVERDVRFVQVSHSLPKGYWDAHSSLKKNHERNAGKVDKPIAGLLKDLKRRGMLEDTLVICGTEFGRTPAAQGKNGRDHHPHAYTIWMAGGGIKGGMTYGATDEFGYYITENKVHIHDLHATILHLVGLDHTKLTYRYSGRDFRLTDVGGEIPFDILR